MAIGYLKALLALGFVLGLIALLAWLAARYRLGHLPARGARRLAVIEALPIDPRRKLVLVRLDEREYLLLLGQDGNRLIAPDGTPPRPPAEGPAAPPDLGRAASGGGAIGAPAAPPAGAG